MESRYYRFKSETFRCKKCKWEGLGSALKTGELFESLFELDCPQCHAVVDHISYPTAEETLMFGSEAEKKDALQSVERRNAYLAAQLKDISLLPDIDDTDIAFVLTPFDDVYLAIMYKEQVIWKEKRGYEYYERYIAVGRLLKEKYGDKMIDFVPLNDDLNLYGDRLSAIDKVNAFRAELRG